MIPAANLRANHCSSHPLPIGNATHQYDEGNSRKFYVGINSMIPAYPIEAAPRRTDEMR